MDESIFDAERERQRVANGEGAPKSEDDIFAAEERRQAERAVRSIERAKEVGGADVIDLAKRRGVSPEYASENRAEFQRIDDAEKAWRVVQDAPKTAQWVSRPENAGYGADNLDNLADLERRIRDKDKFNLKNWLLDTASKTPAALDAGRLSFMKGIAGVNRSFSETDPITQLFFPEQAEREIEMFAERGRMFDELAALRRPEYADKLQQGIFGGFESLTQMIPGIVAGAVTRNPLVGAGAMGVNTYGQEYQEAREQGLGVLPATGYGAVQGGIEVATEKIPMDFLLKDAKDMGLLKRFFRYQMAEQLTEQVATHAQDFVNWQVLNRDKTVMEYLAERPDAALQTVIGTAVASGSIQGAMMGVEKLAEMVGSEERKRDAEERATTLTELQDLVRGNPLYSREARAMEDFLDTATGNEMVYLDAAGVISLYQADGFDGPLIEHLGLTEEQINEARLGTDVEVPLSKILTAPEVEAQTDTQQTDGEQTAEGQEQKRFSPLIEIMKRSVDDEALIDIYDREKQQVEADGGVQLDELLEDIMEADRALEGSERVERAVRDQLLGIGRDLDVADAEAKVWGAVFRKFESYGLDAETIFDKMGMVVQNQDGVTDAPVTLEDGRSFSAGDIRALRRQARQTGKAVPLAGFIRRIGLNPSETFAGEIEELNNRRLINRSTGLDLDYAAQEAANAGYIQTDENGKADVNDFLNALREDLAGEAEGGNRVFSTNDLEEVQKLKDRNAARQTLDEIAAARQAADDETLNAAIDAGYEGTDRGEAREWMQAVISGLDMSQEARIERAKDQGFKVTKFFFHGTGADIEAFLPSRGGRYGPGVYVTADPNVAGSYAAFSPPTDSRGQEQSPNVVKVFVRGKLADKAHWYFLAEQAQMNGVRPADQAYWISEQLKQRGFDGVDLVSEMVVFDPKNIRSVNAAFNPTQSDSANILAQAQQAGYDGEDRGEAKEWLRAVDKGLDMSTEARMARARDMGFDTEQTLYHGTTADFLEFDTSFGNIESDWGAGIYTTNEPSDVASNYAGVGPDLTNKIEREAERIASETDREYDDPNVVAEAHAKWIQHEGATLPVFVRLSNPVVVGGGNETVLTYEEEYNEEFDEYGEPSGSLVNFVEALIAIHEEDLFYDFDVDDVNTTLVEAAFDFGGLPAERIHDIVKEKIPYAQDNDTGDMASSEILRLAFERAGFDGVVDHTVNKKFGSERERGQSMAGMNPDTVHVIVFDPKNIRSIHAAFDPDYSESTNILAQEDALFQAAMPAPGILENFQINPSKSGLKRMLYKMAREQIQPVVRLVQTQDGTIYAFDGWNYTHDDFIQAMGMDAQLVGRGITESADVKPSEIRFLDHREHTFEPGNISERVTRKRSDEERDENELGTKQFVNKPEYGMTDNQAKIAEMAINGFTNEDIAEEMETSKESVKVILSRVRKKLKDFDIEIPKSRAGRSPTLRPRVADLIDEGFDNGQIAERVGMTREEVAVMRYQIKKHREAGDLYQQEALRSLTAARTMTPEQRSEWFDENVNVISQDDGSIVLITRSEDGAEYGGDGDVKITIGPTFRMEGAVEVAMTYRGAYKLDVEQDSLSPAEKRENYIKAMRVFSNAAAVLQEHISRNDYPAVFFSSSDTEGKRDKLYETLLRGFNQPGYQALKVERANYRGRVIEGQTEGRTYFAKPAFVVIRDDQVEDYLNEGQFSRQDVYPDTDYTTIEKEASEAYPIGRPQVRGSDAGGFGDSGDNNGVIRATRLDTPNKAETLFQEDAGGEKPLFFAHNTSLEKLKKTLEIGGFPMPSMAVARIDRGGFSGFGEITLLMNPDKLDERAFNAHTADLYSPTVPTVWYEKNKEASKKYYESLQALVPDEISIYPGSEPLATEYDFRQSIRNDTFVQLDFLSKEGRIPKVPLVKISPEGRKASKLDYNSEEFVALAEAHFKKLQDDANAKRVAAGGRPMNLYFKDDGALEYRSLRDFEDMVSKFRRSKYDREGWLREVENRTRSSNAVRKRYDKHVDNVAGILQGRKLIFKGWTYNGNRKMVDYNVDNIMREMRRELRDPQGTIFTGAGYIRGKRASERLPSKKRVKAKRDMIVSESEFEELKEESGRKFTELADKIEQYWKFSADNHFMLLDNIAMAIADGPAAIRESFEPDAFPLIDNYVKYLQGLPTEYFEAKPNKVVELNEFSTAVIPRSVPDDIKQALKDAGLSIKTYKSGDEADRLRVISGQDNLLFQEDAGAAAPVFYSALERFVRDHKQAKGSPDQWAGIIKKAPGIKAEELEWTGILDVLNDVAERGRADGNGNSITREELADIIQRRGVTLETVVATEDGADGENRLIEWGDPVVWDDPEAWEHGVDDLINEDEYSNIFNFEERAIERLRSEEADYIRANVDAEILEQAEADLSGSEAINDWIKENFQDEIEGIKQELAENIAHQEYFNDPLYVRHSTNLDLMILGNEDQGFQVIHNGHWAEYSGVVRRRIWSVSEAEIQAQEYAIEAGLLESEVSTGAAKWGDYVTDGPHSDYREFKLTLPDIEGDFYNESHFLDRNIVAFLRTTDRTLLANTNMPQEELVELAKTRLERINQFLASEDKYRVTSGQLFVAEEESRLLKEFIGGAISYDALKSEFADRVSTANTPLYGKKLSAFFIEELQSDWHQQGRQMSYDNDSDRRRGQKMIAELQPKLDAASKRARDAREASGEAFKTIFPKDKQRLALEDRPDLTPRDIAKINQDRFREGVIALGVEAIRDTANTSVDTSVDMMITVMTQFDAGIRRVVAILAGETETGKQEKFEAAIKSTFLGDNVNVDKIREIAEIELEIHEANKEANKVNNEIERIRYKLERAVPDAPFKGDAWINLSVKKAIMQAVAEGKDALAWADAEVVKERWSDTYAELYENIYDRKMVKMIRKLTGQAPQHFNMDGQPWTGDEEGYWLIEITDELRAKVADQGFPLFQKKGDRTVYGQAQIPGALTDTPQILGDRNTIVTLTKASNKTTFLHESAHIFLELYRALESESPEIAKDMARIRNWLGLKDGEQLTRDHHEKFADSFEKYLMEGNAPSPELRGVFRKFKAWFIEAYRALRGKRTLPNLNDEAREIFDSLLATQDDIDAVKRGFIGKLSTHLSDIMTPEQIEQWNELAQKAGDVAEEKLFRKFVNQIRRREKAEWKAEEKALEEEIRAQVMDMPVYRAFEALVSGEVKLDRNEIVSRRGEDAPGRMPQGATAVYTREGGWSADALGPSFGFATGDAMLNALIDAPHPERYIRDEVARIMKDRHGDLERDGTIEREAVEAVFNTESIKLLEAQRNAISNRVAGKPIPLKDISARAKETINKEPIKNVIQPGRYAIKARTLGRQALQFAARGRWEDALRATTQAMYQHELAREAYKARAEVEKINRFLGRFTDRKLREKATQKRLAAPYIKRIMEVMNLPGSEGQGVVRESLRDFAEKETLGGFPVTLPTAVLVDEDLPSRINMSMEQLRDFRDSIANLNQLGREQSEADARALATRVELIVDEMDEAWGDKDRREYSKGQKRYLAKVKEQAGKAWRGFEAEFLRWPFLVEALQGGKDGRVVEALDGALRRAITDRNSRRIDMGKKLADILKRHGIGGELNKMISVPQVVSGAPIKFSQLMAVALNMGTVSNRERLIADASINSDVDGLMLAFEDHFEKRHWDAVQEIWDLIGTLWPEASAVHERTTGIAPKKVEAAQIETPFGTYAGGYYPIKYDKYAPENADIAERTEADLWKQHNSGAATSAATRKGFLIERQEGVKRPLSLDLSVILEHFDDVTNDIYMREPATEVWKIINHRRFKTEMYETHGEEYLKAMKTILARSVSGIERPNGFWENVFRTARINASVAILGFNIRSALLAPVSYFQTVIPRYGVRIVAQGVAAYAKDPILADRFVREKSKFMRERYDTMTREAHEMVRQSPNRTLMARFQSSGYWMMTNFERVTVSGALWLGVYNDAIAKGQTEDQAITAAERAIATTQGSGLEMDQSVMQGGTEFQRALTFMYSYVSGYYGIVRNDIAGKRGFMKVMPMMKHFIIMNTIAAMLEALIREGLPGDDEDDPYLESVITLMGRNTFGLVPGLTAALSRYSSEPAAQALAQDIGDVLRTLRDAAEEQAEQGYIEGDTMRKVGIQAVGTLGLGFGVPGVIQLKQIEKTYSEDDDPTPWEALVTGPDDDN